MCDSSLGSSLFWSFSSFAALFSCLYDAEENEKAKNNTDDSVDLNNDSENRNYVANKLEMGKYTHSAECKSAKHGESENLPFLILKGMGQSALNKFMEISPYGYVGIIP